MSPLNVQCGCFRAGHLACNQLCASQDSIAQELVDDSHALEDQVDPQIEFPDNQLGLPASEEDAAEPPADPVAGEVAAENAAEPPAVPVAGEVAAEDAAEPPAEPVAGESAKEGKVVEEALKLADVARPFKRLKRASPFVEVELISDGEGEASFSDAGWTSSHWPIFVLKVPRRLGTPRRSSCCWRWPGCRIV